MTIEREEGLFTTHGLTRLLCIAVLTSWILGTVLAVLWFWMLVTHSALVMWMTSHTWFLVALVVVAHATSLWSLMVWRKCARCKGALFRNRPMTTYKGLLAARKRDYRAKTFLGSYLNRAIIDMALTGHLHCQWCNQEDGVTPEYYIQQ